MKTLAVAALVACSVLTSVANADPAPHYRGQCSFGLLNDTSPGGWLGGPEAWTGIVSVRVVATDGSSLQVPTGHPISVECELTVDGESRGTLLSAAGIGAAVNADVVGFTASISQVIEVCENVTVDGATTVYCRGFTQT